MFKLKIETEGFLRTFASSFILSNHIKGSDIMYLDVSTEIGYLPIKDIHNGFKAATILREYVEERNLTYEDANVQIVLRTAREFYQEFINQAQIRFDFSAPIFKHLVMLDHVRLQTWNPLRCYRSSTFRAVQTGTEEHHYTRSSVKATRNRAENFVNENALWVTET